MELNKNASKKIALNFLIDFYIDLKIELLLMFEDKTILEINSTKWLLIKPSFVKTSMQIIQTMYYVNFYFLVIYHPHW